MALFRFLFHVLLCSFGRTPESPASMRFNLPGGRAMHLYANGVVLPAMAGADDDDDDSDDDSDDEDSEDDEDDSEDDDSDDDSEDDDEDEDEDSEDEEDDEDAESKKPGFLRRIARRNERRYKREKEKAERLQKQLDDLKAGKDDGGDDKNDAAIKAKEQELKDKEGELEEERRSFRLERTVNSIAKKGVKVGEGKKAKARKFKDSDDVLVHVERALAKGDLDADEVYDKDGRVDREAVEDFIADLVSDKEHLLADAEKRKPKGGGDGGRGKGGGGGDSEDLEEMSHEDLYKAARSRS